MEPHRPGHRPKPTIKPTPKPTQGTLGLSRNPREPRRSKPRAPVGAPARRAAAHALGAVARQGLTLDAAEARHLGRLGERDAALARRILRTTLRRRRQIAELLGGFLEKEIAPGPVADILATAAAQILFLRVPAHAAVNIATALTAAAASGAGLKGLVNAVLRRLAEAGPARAEAQDAARLAVPDWLWERWCANWGAEVARAAGTQIIAEPPLDLTVKDDAAGWAARLGGTALPSGSVRLAEPGPVSQLPGYAEGAWWVQDAAAALPARLIRNPVGLRVIDLCAAPGGKTAQLALAHAEVTALDRDAARMARLVANLARLGLDAHTVVADALRWRPERPADAVLVDAPCTATGIMRRRPDIALRRRPEHLGPQVATQRALIAAALEMLRPGGSLVYCACSLEPEEGEAHHDDLLAGAGVAADPIAPDELPGFENAITDRGTLRVLPTHLAEAGGADGFFAFRVSKS